MGKKKIDKKSIVLVGVMILMTILLYFRDIAGHQIDKFVFLGIGAAYALYADYRHLLMFIAFVFPLVFGLPGNYLFPILSVLLVLKGGEKIHIPPLVWISILLISVSELLHLTFLSQEPDYPEFVGYISALFLLLFIGGVNDLEADNAKNALCFCLGSCVLMGVIILNFNALVGGDLINDGVRVGNVSQYSDTEGMRLTVNANGLALYSITTMAMVFTLWYYKKVSFLLLSLISMLSFIAGVYSLSRTWIISLILFGFLFIIFSRGKRLSVILVFVLALVGLLLFYSIRGDSLLGAFGTRFQGENIQTAGLRTVLFAQYHDWMMSHPWATITGVGSITYKEVTGIYGASHNAFQQIFLAYGFPGLFLFLFLFYKCIKKWYIRKEKFYAIPLIVVFFFVQSIPFLNPMSCMLPFIASLFVYKMLKQDSISY